MLAIQLGRLLWSLSVFWGSMCSPGIFYTLIGSGMTQKKWTGAQLCVCTCPGFVFSENVWVGLHIVFVGNENPNEIYTWREPHNFPFWTGRLVNEMRHPRERTSCRAHYYKTVYTWTEGTVWIFCELWFKIMHSARIAKDIL